MDRGGWKIFDYSIVAPLFDIGDRNKIIVHIRVVPDWNFSLDPDQAVYLKIVSARNPAGFKPGCEYFLLPDQDLIPGKANIRNNTKIYIFIYIYVCSNKNSNASDKNTLFKLSIIRKFFLYLKQRCGSISFWRRSGIVDPDPVPWILFSGIVELDPDPWIHLWK